MQIITKAHCWQLQRYSNHCIYTHVMLNVVCTMCSGMIKIRKGREDDLEVAVATFGPVTAVVDSQHNTFQVRTLCTPDNCYSFSPLSLIHSLTHYFHTFLLPFLLLPSLSFSLLPTLPPFHIPSHSNNSFIQVGYTLSHLVLTHN